MTAGAGKWLNQRQQLATLLDWSAYRFHLPTPNWTATLAQ